ncbi:ABC transporter ATP-binding protein [Rhizobiaceae bacterium BDR2-2]|uniref:ABC transporter ATP-binding protein n=1 Tax=Ectorhizobium quercum TaxID=2965071 RepID=A0AAE3N0L7_9HYPH|nr:ABC transporter ATP-binding protein [Ectorhizobium quercum]MCX8997931.1 ABC transporter ATP-binding protein [Ectorhizobium quercum]
MKNSVIDPTTATPLSAPANAAGLKLHAQGLCKFYDGFAALHPTDLKVRSGELLTLLGPSGSGKTTLLQLICGLVKPSDGILTIDGRDHTETLASQRDVGVVFQNYALFPHLTVHENVAFPLQMRRIARTEAARRIGEALEMVGLSHFGKRFPLELSGGQQQRVALARCLVYHPSLILMDESLSALDRKLREAMQIEIRRIHRETGSTIIFVTHDQEEALALSDRICLMNAGRIEQIGSPQEIYERPVSRFAADFIGVSTIFEGAVEGDRLVSPEGVLPLPAPAKAQKGFLVIRPEHIRLEKPEEARLAGRLEETIYAGPESRLIIRLDSGLAVTARRSSSLPPLRHGETVGLSWNPEDARFLDR